ncbi:MAG: glycosyltransferase family 4 protein [Caldilineaceae bacterium]
MRLLFLTNFYPPASRGGYEEWCAEVAEWLRAAGHQVRVLTSRHGAQTLDAPDPAWVERRLHLEMELASLRNAVGFFTQRRARQAENLKLLRMALVQQQPDAIVVWGMWNLPRALPALAEMALPDRTVYYMGDYWPTLPNQFENYWNAAPRNLWTGLPKRLLAPVARRQLRREPRPALQLARLLFPTGFMQQEFARQGISPQQARIIPGAIDVSRYPFNNTEPNQRNADEPLRLLYVGRLTHDKGAHLAIEAVGQIHQTHPAAPLKLTIVGAGDAPYRAELRALAQKLAVSALVEFVGAQPKEALPQFYQQADIFLFTSLWAEPFGRVLVEAMASGAVVVGAATGGAAEIMQHEGNALTFAPGNVSELVTQIQRLRGDEALQRRLRANARCAAEQKFDIRQMAAGIEAYLEKMVAGR